MELLDEDVCSMLDEDVCSMRRTWHVPRIDAPACMCGMRCRYGGGKQDFSSSKGDAAGILSGLDTVN